MSETIESAIPLNLQTERTLPPKIPPNFVPPYPSYCARFPQSTKDLVFAILGAQCTSEDQGVSAKTRLTTFIDAASVPVRPSFWEVASVKDTRGYFNVTVLAYWPAKAAYDEWASASGFESWWQSLDAETEPHGWFLEIFFPSIDRIETVFTDTIVPEGAGHMRDGISGLVREHGYWGSMRDRFPISQTDELVGEKAAAPANSTSQDGQVPKRRVHVPGRQNLTVIRSGQDWSNTLPNERTLYINTMHPVLIKGMDFLRDNGKEVGCYSCRFMDIVDQETLAADKDRTFGLAFFDELASLEGWAKSHPTHLDIFGRFFQYAKELENSMSLRLFHEVLVLKPEQQMFEYVGCHVGTGMMAAQ